MGACAMIPRKSVARPEPQNSRISDPSIAEVNNDMPGDTAIEINTSNEVDTSPLESLRSPRPPRPPRSSPRPPSAPILPVRRVFSFDHMGRLVEAHREQNKSNDKDYDSGSDDE